jgi:hypothetical protein
VAARSKWWHVLQASKREALLAVDLYNRAASARSLEGFVMHMHVAWLYLAHARFAREGVDFRYSERNGHFMRVDGEVKTWELARCVREMFPLETNPVRCNVEFFIKARNKIEHRYEALLATALAGKSQALVLNYEETLSEWFGPSEGLAEELRFPVFMSSLTPQAVEALKATHRRLPKKLSSFIREHDAALPAEVSEDWRYDLRVLLLPQTGPKTESDAVMRFVREDEMTSEQRDVVQTIVRTKAVAVQNKGRHKPGQAAKLVSTALGVVFSTNGHNVAAWKHYKVRPDGGASRPELTDDRYCVYDEPHSDYLFTDAWIEKLSRDLADPQAFRRVTGSAPKQTKTAFASEGTLNLSLAGAESDAGCSGPRASARDVGLGDRRGERPRSQGSTP